MPRSLQTYIKILKLFSFEAPFFHPVKSKNSNRNKCGVQTWRLFVECSAQLSITVFVIAYCTVKDVSAMEKQGTKRYVYDVAAGQKWC